MCLDKDYRAFFALMQLISPNFPIGGFSYSRGLEWAVSFGWVNSTETFSEWQKQWINGQLLYLDWPMMKCCYDYTKMDDPVNFFQCALKILSYRDTYEIRLEEQQRGQMMTQLILQWYSSINKHWLLGLESSGLAAIAWLGCMWKIPLETLSLGYAYNMLESSVITGLKLVLFGQSTAQKLLKCLTEFLIHAWHQVASINNNALGSSFPLQSIASACHETQYSRLFRS